MLNRFKKKIESVMYDVERSNENLTDVVLSGLSGCYHKVMQIRESLYQQEIKKSYSLPCYVISVGNITVGGTGKTPMVIYLARLIKKMGYKPAIVSRGYGGTASAEGGIVSDGQTIMMDPHMAGDEPYMIAEKLLNDSVPVVIGSNRYSAGMVAVKEFSPDVIILDDGFQHLKLKRDLDILLFDSTHPIGNGNMLPRGTLREPLAAISRADVFVLTRVENSVEQTAVQTFHRSVSEFISVDTIEEIPVVTSSHSPLVIGSVKPLLKEIKTIEDLNTNLSVYAFSGIAKNHEFRKTAVSMGFSIKGFSEFQDHHSYTENDCKDLIGSAEKSGATVLITTEKDYVKIADLDLDFELIIIGIDIDFGSSEELFSDFIKMKILKSRGDV